MKNHIKIIKKKIYIKNEKVNIMFITIISINSDTSM
jgi:hypothetical protein